MNIDVDGFLTSTLVGWVLFWLGFWRIRVKLYGSVWRKILCSIYIHTFRLLSQLYTKRNLCLKSFYCSQFLWLEKVLSVIRSCWCCRSCANVRQVAEALGVLHIYGERAVHQAYRYAHQLYMINLFGQLRNETVKLQIVTVRQISTQTVRNGLYEEATYYRLNIGPTASQRQVWSRPKPHQLNLAYSSLTKEDFVFRLVTFLCFYGLGKEKDMRSVT